LRLGRITKGDALSAKANPAPAAKAPSPAAPSAPRELGPREERVRMSRLRQTIARRLKEAQNTAAMLTTYNEVDMTNIMEMRKQYKELFIKKHGVKLGFMSFFVKACVQALKDVPAVNAEIDGTDIIYKNYYDISIAVGTPKGLVVPVLRDCDERSLGGVEKGIGELGAKARDGQLSMDDMMGGTFTISNGPMSAMGVEMDFPERRSKRRNSWLGVVGACALVWYIFGLIALIISYTMSLEIAQGLLSWEQLRYVMTTPIWAKFFGITAQIAGLMGSVFILFRKANAYKWYMLSLISFLIIMLDATFRGGFELMDSTHFGVSMIGIIIGVYLFWAAYNAKNKGELRTT